MQLVIVGAARLNGMVKLYQRLLIAFTVDSELVRVDSTAITCDKTES